MQNLKEKLSREGKLYIYSLSFHKLRWGGGTKGEAQLAIIIHTYAHVHRYRLLRFQRPCICFSGQPIVDYIKADIVTVGQRRRRPVAD